MALSNGYGVVIGTKSNYYRDPVNNYGQYFHGNVDVATPAGSYHCAIDVDSKSVKNGVAWKVVELTASQMKGIASRPYGWHPLASTSTSGALDYIREPALVERMGCWLGPWIIFARMLPTVMQPTFVKPWKTGTSIEALADLEPLLDASKRVFIFGEPFTDGLGVHNIHQNQGDPVNSQWAAENGIWQDGGTIVERKDGTYAAFLNKFSTQASQTDNQGHPI
jgi:hypothetical protein